MQMINYSPSLKRKKIQFNQATVFITISMIDKYIRLLVWILDIQDPTPFYLLGKRIVSLIKLSGTPHTVMYLKESLRVIQKFISGERLDRSDGIRMGLTSGLPRILPSILRSYIRESKTNEIRAILSIVSLFRVMRYKPQLKLSTITSPFKGMSPTLPRYELKTVLDDLKPLMTIYKNVSHVSYAAGPNISPASFGFSLDAFALKDHPHLLESIRILSEFFKGFNVYDSLLKEINLVQNLTPIKEPILSKLSLKEEGAGKVRVFAILDS
jgi:hypothetical protein